MNRVLLVDDDPIVLIHLREMINWEKIGCELVGEASNGKEALELIERLHPQIVITDINMPGINGIDLISYIGNKEYKRDCQVIAISAFDDFNYVRGSLKNGASDYLLKHQLATKVLEEAIAEVCIDANKNSEEDGYSLAEKKEHLMYSILHDRLEKKDAELLNELQMGWLMDEMVLVLVEEDQSNEVTNTELLFALIDETIKYCKEYQIIKLENSQFLLIFSTKKQDLREIKAVVDQVGKNVKRFCGLNLSFVMSCEISDYKEIGKTLLACRKLFSDQRFKGKEQFFTSFQKTENSTNYHWGIEQEEKLLKDIAEGRKVEAIFNDVFACIDKEHSSKNQILFLSVELLTLLLRKVEEVGVQEQEIFQEMNMYEKLSALETIEEIEKYLIQKYEKLQEIILEKRKNSFYSKVVREAIGYIQQNYSKKISLTKMAEQLAVSPAHLSRTFKKDTGMNITAYMNEIRLEAAKKIMSDGIVTMNEVAFMSGFENYNYFYILFKEKYNITQSEYIKECANNIKK